MAKRKNADAPSAGNAPTRKKKRASKRLKAKFDAAHAVGMKALEEHDYDTLGKVIAQESDILHAQSELIEEHIKTAAGLSRRLTAKVKNAKKAKKKR